ncbi:hypothetical protein G7B40_004460 [Aetokthonos hydrillicola Thurmond2011]|jgi:hypothetical protein|uniref:Glutathione S-transferase n=1 Tax=Aetokthonos hydrillicola Thurmond2011 TaxID=2712845 RepID=A0AAP5I2B5_9CYAN|nr:hypothetical protein [Aetokthonos hydrillicola]MBO3457530.1 hypothetical protein [Aetokthonos hydrillicola CCALA 1050]MDR9893827.1 hypothetical protein [Aetokthonos hydrillicola Thurmond2011]
MGIRKAGLLTVVAGVTLALTSRLGASVIALPPPEDTPEEILRTEIITEGRSPIDGTPVNAAEYAELQAQLQTRPTPKLAPVIRQNIFLLRLRKALRVVFPFLKF